MTIQCPEKAGRVMANAWSYAVFTMTPNTI